ncbi:MAG: Unknown protein [uncultured Aureispira sp.]|uniref:Uncharacterized protein n=1 Tax=uncultured Aureispira sp. TaxID=1331704 RepID=A0A6S6UAQ8_9BACT|nr:MAG: Unknown protein [uncultured Aureispira sp.]
MKLIALLFLISPCFIQAQSGYTRWHFIQEGTEIHLAGNYKEKKVYGSRTGVKSDLKLSQIQQYEKGRLVKDKVYIDYPTLMYDIVLNYQKDGTAIGMNLEDSSAVTYAFTKTNKLRYYVVDEQHELHVVYTYNDAGDLIRCKDCLAPFEEHNWCAYYRYAYNNKNQLIGVASYKLKKGAEVDTKTLFEADSLVYENDLLKVRWTLDTAGEAVQKASYSYDKKGLLLKEHSTQLGVDENSRSYLKSYTYHCNRQLKSLEEAYYTNDSLDGKQISKYNKKGNKIKQESYRGDGKRTKLYFMKYKG